MSDPIFRIHPSIGFARVGESDEFYLQPETSAGTVTAGLAGGCPLRPDSDKPDSDTPITDGDLRDDTGAMKRQAARFKIFMYPSVGAQGAKQYPEAIAGQQVVVGKPLPTDPGGPVVEAIVWTVHLANKKANWFGINDFVGIDIFSSDASKRVFDKVPQTLDVRNPLGDKPVADPGPDIGYPELQFDIAQLSTSQRRTQWVIDAGPRGITGVSTGPVNFDAGTPASRGDGASVVPTPNYPISFPSMHFKERVSPTGEIDTLGELRTDNFGRLLVLPAFGRSCAVNGAALEHFVDNQDWFDDTADGPVSATIICGGKTIEVVGAWVVSTDPAYAPQIRNAVSLWDDIYDTFVRKMQLDTDLYSDGFVPSFQPDFAADIQPFFKAASLQQWIANLPPKGVAAHGRVGKIAADTSPTDTELNGLGVIRDPSATDAAKQQRTMPLSLGDAGQSFMSPTPTQYFFLQRWDAAAPRSPARRLGPGETLDRAALENCLGGRFSPGIDVTFICRDVNLYIQDWAVTGPFRINPKPLDYSGVKETTPFLTVGYVPLQDAYNQVEPGDLCKFMAIPWHADYNSCATHLPEPNPTQNNVLFWSWPAQRPVAVHVASDVSTGDQLPPQRFSVRGTGTTVSFAYQTATEENNSPIPLRNNADAQIREVWNEGRYQNASDMLVHWSQIGTVLQSSQIEGLPQATPTDWFLEVGSKLEGPEDSVQDWPSPTVPPSGLSKAKL